jgi:hypothetical protein
LTKDTIYKYIDRNGIPFKKMASIGITNGNFEIRKDDNFKQKIKIELPFDLSPKEQNEIVLDYI